MINQDFPFNRPQEKQNLWQAQSINQSRAQNESGLSDVGQLEEAICAALMEKIPHAELSAAHLSPEWTTAREVGFQISDCQSIKDYTSLLAFEALITHFTLAQAELMTLMSSVAKRHLNEIRVLPAPATVASHCIAHTLSCSVLAGKKHAPFQKRWQSLLEKATQRFNTMVQKPALHLTDLDSGLLREDSIDFAELCQDLVSEAVLLLQTVEMIASTYDATLKSGKTSSQWISLDFSQREESSARMGSGILDEFRNSQVFMGFKPGHPLPSCIHQELINHRFKEFVLQIWVQIDNTRRFTTRLADHDKSWFANQFQNISREEVIENENIILIRALAHRLRMAGENLEDIELFAKGLVKYTREHRVSCLNMLDEEFSQLAPRIAPQVLAQTRNDLRMCDINFPLSIKHKTMIAQNIKKADAIVEHIRQAQNDSHTSKIEGSIAESGKRASAFNAPPEFSPPSLDPCMPSVPGVTSAKRSP